jgi:hypothetical protein
VVWGLVGLRGYAFGQQVAPNGLEFNPLFSLDLNLDTWLWREQRLYLFSDARFWTQNQHQSQIEPENSERLVPSVRYNRTERNNRTTSEGARRRKTCSLAGLTTSPPSNPTSLVPYGARTTFSSRATYWSGNTETSG